MVHAVPRLCLDTMVDIGRVASCFVATSLAWSANLDPNDRTPVRSVDEILEGDTRSFAWYALLESFGSGKFEETESMLETLAATKENFAPYFGHFGVSLKQCRGLDYSELGPKDLSDFAGWLNRFKETVDSWSAKDEL